MFFHLDLSTHPPMSWPFSDQRSLYDLNLRNKVLVKGDPYSIAGDNAAMTCIVVGAITMYEQSRPSVRIVINGHQAIDWPAQMWVLFLWA